MSKNISVYIISLLILVGGVFISYCSEDKNNNSNNNNDYHAKHTDESNNNDESKDSAGDAGLIEDDKQTENDNITNEHQEQKKDYDAPKFFTEARKKYESYYEYLNSFSEGQAPSGINFFKKTVDLGSFLNKQGREHPEIVKSETYKNFYKLFVMIEKIVSKSDEIELSSDEKEKKEYVKYYNQKLSDVNKLLENIKNSVKDEQ